MASSFATTSIDTFTSFFQWNITNAKAYLSSKSSLTSPVFIPDTKFGEHRTKWQLHISFSSTPASMCCLSVKSQKLVSHSYNRLFVKGYVSFIKNIQDDFIEMIVNLPSALLALGNTVTT